VYHRRREGWQLDAIRQLKLRAERPVQARDYRQADSDPISGGAEHWTRDGADCQLRPWVLQVSGVRVLVLEVSAAEEDHAEDAKAQGLRE